MKQSKTKAVSSVKGGQGEQLRQLVRQSFVAVGVGVVMLILFLVGSIFLSKTQKGLLSAVSALDQYRLGSKALTYSVQSYAVTGDEKYYNQYMKELNEDKNRDKALEALKSTNITDSEWDGLNQIAELSNGLVPLEEAAMECVKQGDLEAAKNHVFSEEYEATIDKINSQTDAVIAQITGRKEKETNLLNTTQLIFQILFICSFIYVLLQFVRTFQFANKELLQPIKKVSDDMEALAGGNFGTVLDLKADDSEVGTMVKDIAFMKQNLRGMIQEISGVLEQMGDGNYRIHIDQDYVGEFARIKESLLTIGERTRDTLHAIRNASGQIDKGSEQLACAAEELAEGSTAQASQVAELVKVIDERAESI